MNRSVCFVALLAATSLVACGDAPPMEDETPPASNLASEAGHGNTHTAFTAPTASLSCTRNPDSVDCIGTATGSATPYRNQWATKILFDGEVINSPWSDGDSTFSQYCATPDPGTIPGYTLQIRYRVVTNTGLVSNIATGGVSSCE